MIAFAAVFALILLLVAFDLIKFIFLKERLFKPLGRHILYGWVLIGLPTFYLIVINENKNDCCSDSASFSPDHILSLYVCIAVCIGAFFYSYFKKDIAPPLLEVLINSLLVLGCAVNLILLAHLNPLFSILGNTPILLAFILQLFVNQQKLVKYIKEQELSAPTIFNTIAWKFLRLPPLLKFPMLLLLCLPILFIVTAFLLLFGQKPDSYIRVFTDTYKHGLSQLDYMCENVDCGGHYLCSVAANGHSIIVKPERYGMRGGKMIICNRQLLVSNAFEELLQERLPHVHKGIRLHYNKVGNFIHRYYDVFSIKLLSDVVYYLMKPAEWFFVACLYSFDSKPENRIAQQYLKTEERSSITKHAKALYNKRS